jgi:hypothetical protein
MSLEVALAWIGGSHLLQPPLAYLVTQRLALRAALAQSPPLLGQLLQNMVLASIALPSMAGVLLALHAHEALQPGAARSLAWLLSVFWSWRFVRQCTAAALWRSSSPGRAVHLVLCTIFLVQGPGLGLILALGSATQTF